MDNILSIFGKPYTPDEDAAPRRAEDQLYEKLLDLGELRITAGDIIGDGQIHRFQIGRKQNKNGWYVLYADGVPAGAYGDWAGGTFEFVADVGRELTSFERMANANRINQAKAKRQAADEAKHKAVAGVVEAVWSAAVSGDDHPYLQRKRISAVGARIAEDGRLVVPMRNMGGELSSLQYIDDNGGKLFHAGGKAGGCFFSIGQPGNLVYLVEGFADAASVFEATGAPVVAALSANNMPVIAGMLRERYGQQLGIVVVSDNDASGTGERVAKESADKAGCRIVTVPPEYSDISDFYLAGGDVAALLAPQVAPDFLVSAADFVKQPAPIRWIIKGWLQDKAMMMLFGPSGAGKSFIAIDHACHIAAGLPEWNGCKVNGGTVVYLAGEGHHGMKARVAGWLAAHNNPELDMYISQYGVDLNTPEGYTKVTDALRAASIQPALIVVDTLHRFLHGDENSAEDAKTMIDACNGLMREFDCSVQLVHHTGVSPEAQKRARGSSAWKGALDIEICVSGETIQQTKTKDSEPMAGLHYKLVSHDVPGWLDEDGEQVTTALVQIGGEVVEVDRLHGAKQTFKTIWTATGYDLADNGLPYVSTAAIERWLTSDEGGAKTAATARRYAANAGSKAGAELIKSGYLMKYRSGFCLQDADELSSYMIMRSSLTKSKK